MSKPDTTQIDASKGGGKTDWAVFDALTDEEVAAAVARDPDAVASTPEELARMRRVSPARFIRQRMSMSPKRFAETFDIPLATLLAWERHESEPTAVELAYLRAIERNPDSVRKVPA